MSFSKTLFVLLPLAIGVGCGGCDPIDTGDTQIDTGETGDTDTTPVDYEVTFLIDPPVEGASLSAVYVRQEEQYPEDIGCETFPCEHVVHEIGTWLVHGERSDYLLTTLNDELTIDDDGLTVPMEWTEEASHGVLIPEGTTGGWTYVECDENGRDCDEDDEVKVYTEIREHSEWGRDYVAIQGLGVGGMPISGYELDYLHTASGGYHWIGHISEDRQTIYYEKWDGDTLVQSKYLWKR